MERRMAPSARIEEAIEKVLLEINPRPGLWFQLARSAGVDILAAAADDLCRSRPSSSRPRSIGSSTSSRDRPDERRSPR